MAVNPIPDRTEEDQLMKDWFDRVSYGMPTDKPVPLQDYPDEEDD
jgi:hypothetical protein